MAVIYKSNTIFQTQMRENSAHKSNTDTFSELEVTCITFTVVYSIRLRSIRLKSDFNRSSFSFPPVFDLSPTSPAFCVLHGKMFGVVRVRVLRSIVLERRTPIFHNVSKPSADVSAPRCLS
jgi:hypothetical protein